MMSTISASMICTGGGVLLDVFFFEAEDGIRVWSVTGVQTCALPICHQRADRDAGIEVAGVIEIQDRAAVDSAARRLQILDDLHGAHLGRAGEGARREIGRASCRERGERRAGGG